MKLSEENREIVDVLKKILFFLFPKGNYRYYIWYVCFFIVVAAGTFATATMVNLVFTTGMIIQTDTFVASMPLPITGAITPTTMFVATTLWNYSGWLYLAMLIHTGLSVIADILYGIVAGYRWLRYHLRDRRDEL